MRQNTQLDLGIVRRQQHTARRSDECRPNFASELRPYGNILQVWVRRAQPPRRSPRLAELRMKASRNRVNELRQGVGIGGFHLGKLAMLQYFPGELVYQRQFF